MQKLTKVTILTHKLGYNYGGILQAYTLNRTVQDIIDFGQVSTIHYTQHDHIRHLRQSLGGSIRKRSLHLSMRFVDNTITLNTNRFVRDHQLGKPTSTKADVFIVGSDQVWRASYVDPIKYMFGDIEDTTPRISYAASFGTDDLSEYTDAQIQKTAELAKKFRAISVREESGVAIAKKYWGVDAIHHVDPTLLLDADHYSNLIDSEPTDTPLGNLFVYVLDRSAENNRIIEKVEKITHSKSFELLPKEYRSFIDFMRNKEAYVMPKVEQWLRSFRDSDFVVTDSFHGTVFSIIFNKPFIAVGNKSRGLARFSSLLKMFGLESRLVSSASEITPELVNAKIDWENVNKKIVSEQKRSFDYLRQHLS